MHALSFTLHAASMRVTQAKTSQSFQEPTSIGIFPHPRHPRRPSPSSRRRPHTSKFMFRSRSRPWPLTRGPSSGGGEARRGPASSRVLALLAAASHIQSRARRPTPTYRMILLVFDSSDPAIHSRSIALLRTIVLAAHNLPSVCCYLRTRRVRGRHGWRLSSLSEHARCRWCCCRWCCWCLRR